MMIFIAPMLNIRLTSMLNVDFIWNICLWRLPHMNEVTACKGCKRNHVSPKFTKWVCKIPPQHKQHTAQWSTSTFNSSFIESIFILAWTGQQVAVANLAGSVKHQMVGSIIFIFLWRISCLTPQQVQGHAYQNRDEFMEHVRMMHRNSALYNGTVLFYLSWRVIWTSACRLGDQTQPFGPTLRGLTTLLWEKANCNEALLACKYHIHHSSPTLRWIVV